MNDDIKEYWETRAKAAAESPTATTDDIYLRKLEIRTFITAIENLQLKPGAVIVDLGCGDGFSTTQIAEKFKDFKFIGIDYSENMIETARRRLNVSNQLQFRIGDAEYFGDLMEPGSVDVVMTDRCLINLSSSNAQFNAIRGVQSVLKPGGTYLAIENFKNGQDELNRLRAAMGLKEIPVRWHNHFFLEEEFLKQTQALFSNVNITNFSSAYYYATRVIYSKYCQMRGEVPDYAHEIHQLAIDLPLQGDCSPIKFAILTK